MGKRDYTNWTKEELIKELEKFKKQKKYGIVWEDKPEHVALMCKEKLPVLTEVKSKEIKMDKDKPTNILIEGDNYHALSVLNYTHKGKIDVIYIDPPYNTGNEGFMYNDRIVDKEDAYRHSKWLSFMEKRLKLAKNILSNKGVIFISIDDNEVFQLKLLCDEIFGEQNFVANFVWNKKTGRQNDAKFVSVNTEYILCYFKNINYGKINLLPRTKELNKTYKNPDNDPRGPWTSVTLQAKSGREKDVYEIIFPNGVKWTPPKGTYPKFKKEKLLELYKDNRIWFGIGGKNVPRLKKFLSEVKQGLVPNTLLLPFEVGNTQKAKEDYKKVLPEVSFDNPKPLDLIKYLILIGGEKNSIILDFFAGSGTTGQAVLELNRQDNGNRKFILCTNNENNICTDVCYKRIARVINGYETLKGEKVEGLEDNLKYFRTDFVKAEQTDTNKKKLVKKSTEMLCLKENCFDFFVEKEDFKIFKSKEEKYLGIIYDYDGIERFKQEVKKLGKKFVVYIFTLDENVGEEDFNELKNVELKPIPAVILNVYKRIFKGI